MVGIVKTLYLSLPSIPFYNIVTLQYPKPTYWVCINSLVTHTNVICQEKHILHAQAHILISSTLYFWKFGQRITDIINIFFCEDDFWKIRLWKISIIRKSFLFPHCNCFLSNNTQVSTWVDKNRKNHHKLCLTING